MILGGVPVPFFKSYCCFFLSWKLATHHHLFSLHESNKQLTQWCFLIVSILKLHIMSHNWRHGQGLDSIVEVQRGSHLCLHNLVFCPRITVTANMATRSSLFLKGVIISTKILLPTTKQTCTYNSRYKHPGFYSNSN